MPEDEDRFFDTENINNVFGEWKIKYISTYRIISSTSTNNIKLKFQRKRHLLWRWYTSRPFISIENPWIKLQILTQTNNILSSKCLKIAYILQKFSINKLSFFHQFSSNNLRIYNIFRRIVQNTISRRTIWSYLLIRNRRTTNICRTISIKSKYILYW